jgi:hypothetical protein
MTKKLPKRPTKPEDDDDMVWGGGRRLSFGELIRKMQREWRPFLTHAETEVLWFIADRTFAYNKKSEAISERHFLEGFFLRNGSCRHPPCRLKRSQLYGALKSLRELRLLASESRPGRWTKYTLDPDWAPPEMQPNGRRGPWPRTPSVQWVGHQITVDSELESKKSPAGGTANATGIFLGKDKSGSATEQHAAKPSHALLNSLADYWDELVSSCFPQAPRLAWTARNRAQLSAAFIKNFANADPRDFIHDVITFWPSIRKTEFHWLRGEAPAHPNIGFVLRFLDRFLEATSAIRDGGGHMRRLRRLASAQPTIEKLHNQLAQTETDLFQTQAALRRTERELGHITRIRKLPTASEKAPRAAPADPTKYGLPRWDDNE